MAQTRVIIHKSMSWRGSQEDFSNVYTLTGDPNAYSGASWATLIDALVNIEKALHATHVNFKVAYGGDPTEGTIHVRTLTGAGSLALTGPVIHPEVCMLAQAPVDRKRRLSKYFHVGRYDTTGSGDLAAQYQSIASVTNNLAKLTDGTLPNGVKVCAPNGDLPSSTFQLDPYLRVHQFPRGRRRP